MKEETIRGIDWSMIEKVPLEYALVIEHIIIASMTDDMEYLMEAHRELNTLIDSKL